MSATIDAAQVGADFTRTFGTAPDGVWAAPGRVNLIGEHTDYNEGFVLPFAIDRAAAVAIRLRDDSTARLVSSYGEQLVVEVDLDTLSHDTMTGWTAYPLGVVWVMRQMGIAIGGFDLYLHSTVPSGAGLSSSAAIECAVATAFNELENAGLSLNELVLVGQRAENEVVGAPTGILDQSASLLSTDGHAVFLDCRTQESSLVPLDLAAAGLLILVVDTKVTHAHATGGYAARRASCELGAEVLGVAALRDIAAADLPEAAGLLDEETFRRVRHIVTENQRVLDTVGVLGDAGPAAIGALLTASHASMRDDFEISCPELDLAVDTALAQGALGARMTGGGFGGSAIALIPVADEAAVSAAVVRAFADAGFTAPDIFAVSPAPGARKVS
ncbi:galactokinase [Arthrobacter stackebrandtii]|uniref:Galactokinase n=1 Tax=Arthrobacter stackebrandtii TaxID=272161 RepID=A0ABS4YT41_9MICC|nr:galactokinase [Arthrobacter stackebrandtii]MBP2411650.1 galactokinase [Arthrobacter stackebrandtii]PYG99700.1 galactokinase [Arthrobacter stackebrandtii]